MADQDRAASILEWVQEANSKRDQPASLSNVDTTIAGTDLSRASLGSKTKFSTTFTQVPSRRQRPWMTRSKFLKESVKRNKVSFTLNRDAKFRHCLLGDDGHKEDNMIILPKNFTWVATQNNGGILTSYAFPGDSTVTVSSDGENATEHGSFISRQAMRARAPWYLELKAFKEDDGTWVQVGPSAAIECTQSTQSDAMPPPLEGSAEQ